MNSRGKKGDPDDDRTTRRPSQPSQFLAVRVLRATAAVDQQRDLFGLWRACPTRTAPADRAADVGTDCGRRMKKYEGFRNPTSGLVDVSVISYRVSPHGVEYDVRQAHPLRHIPIHSTDGFEWGYGGSGPADLALAILADHLGESRMTVAQLKRGVGSRAWDLHQYFKSDVIGALPKDVWTLTSEDVAGWVTAFRRAEVTA